MKTEKFVNKTMIDTYYREMGTETVYINSILGLYRTLKRIWNRNIVVVSDNWYVRGIASCLNIMTAIATKTQLAAEQYFAMKDALLLLAMKNIPVYYYNRIGLEKAGFVYSDSAQNRMKNHLNFPLMYEKMEQYEDDLKELFGELYSKEYLTEIGRIPQVIEKGNEYRHEDFASKYVNVIEGQRVVCYQPEIYKRTIHVYGRCGAFGYAVEDKNSLPSQIQLQLNNNGIIDIRVVNHGLWGGEDEYLEHNFLNDCVGYKEGDIILFYMMHIDKRLLRHWEEAGVKYKEITHEWHEYPEAKWCFYDKPGHMNHIGYQHVAEIITADLIKQDFAGKSVDKALFADFNSEYLKAYLKKNNNSDFYKEINDYTASIQKEYPLTGDIKECGSIVMNCNPFTKGHRYLIEYAAKQVDRLYIFVVKEDKSFFKYEDRFEMVKQGTADLENVVVVSSGKFIISSLTFPEYFMKDYVKEKNFDVSMDVETFCKHIAPPLQIKKRFAGEEPFDPVTLNYNENMRRILPKYGMEFCEIPRLALDEKRVINATEVRRLLKKRDFDTIKEYVPETTVRILREKY
ncbi:MAG: adenylyltransferase/cytidyltransferase family protein [Bacteroidales bacterium]|nr:adenylyltransferase/cytidyltransferase family protein [Bacteroidales bacterium]